MTLLHFLIHYPILWYLMIVSAYWHLCLISLHKFYECYYKPLVVQIFSHHNHHHNNNRINRIANMRWWYKITFSLSDDQVLRQKMIPTAMNRLYLPRRALPPKVKARPNPSRPVHFISFHFYMCTTLHSTLVWLYVGW